MARDELQRQPLSVSMGQVAVAGARVAHQESMADIGNQQYSGLEQADAGGLADDAMRVQDRLADVNVMPGAAVDRDRLAEGPGIGLRDFRDQHVLRILRRIQFREDAQAAIFFFQVLDGLYLVDAFQQLLSEPPVFSDQVFNATVMLLKPLEELLRRIRAGDDRLGNQADQGGGAIDNHVAVVDAEQRDRQDQAGDQLVPKFAGVKADEVFGHAIRAAACSPDERGRILPKVDVLLENLAAAACHAVKGFVGDDDGNLDFLHDEFIDAGQHGAAAGDDDAAGHDVRG